MNTDIPMTINIVYSPAPIPLRKYTWIAVVDGYEEAQWHGWGESPAEALRDLADTLDNHHSENEPDSCHACSGTGIGRYGDPNTSNCPDCRGTGVVQEPELSKADKEYEAYE